MVYPLWPCPSMEPSGPHDQMGRKRARRPTSFGQKDTRAYWILALLFKRGPVAASYSVTGDTYALHTVTAHCEQD